MHAHLSAAAADWDARSRDPGELYRGPRLASALDWAAQHDDRLNAVEREFIQSSRLESERAARRQRTQNRRLRGLLFGVGVLLVFAVVTGIVALVKQQSASHQARRATVAARVALARQLGAEAVNEPRLDRAMLLAREAVNLDRSPQTEGTLLATLQRSPAVIGAFVLPVDLASQLAVSPDGRTLAVSHTELTRCAEIHRNDHGVGASCGDIQFYDPRTHAVKGSPLAHFGGVAAPVYSSDGFLLAYATDGYPSAIVVRDAQTHALRRTLTFDPFQAARLTEDIAHATVLFSPDGDTVYCAYRVFDFSRRFAKAPGATYLARWSLPSGRRLSTTRIDPGAVLAVRLVDDGARVLVVDARRVSVFDSSSIRRLSSVAITPAPVGPSVAAVSPDGRTVAVGSRTGQMSFVDASTGDARPGTGSPSSPMTSVTYSPDGRAVASTGTGSKVIVWDPRTARSAEVLAAPAERVEGIAFSPDGSTLYTSSVGGVLLEWDLTGDRRFGRRVVLGARSPCCSAVSPIAPPLALSPDGTMFAARLGRSSIGVFSTRTLQRQASFVIRPRRATVTALAWSPTQPELAVGGDSGLVQLWRVNGTPRLERSLTGLHEIPGSPEAIQALAFSPNGQLLAASDSSEAAEQQSAGGYPLALYGNRLAVLAIWRAANGRLVAPLRDLQTGPTRYGALAVSHDGQLLAVSRPDGNDLVIDLKTGQVRRTLHPLGADETVSFAFAPNGTLATGTEGGIVQLWNPITGEQVAGPVAVADGPVTSIAFDRTGQRFTTGGHDGTVKLWSASTLQQAGATLNTEQDASTTAAFEPSGAALIVVDDHGNGFTWPTSIAAWEQRACTVAGRNFTRQEWSRFVTGHRYAKVCP